MITFLQPAKPFYQCPCRVLVIYDCHPVPFVIKIQEAEALHRSWLAARSFEFNKTGNASRKADEPVRYTQCPW